MRRSYAHRDHAGNAADVWKHVVWLALLDALTTRPRALHVVDTHAGEGLYRLASGGEWPGGIGRMRGWPGPWTVGVARWLSAVEAVGGPGGYPGSPMLVQARLRDRDRATLCETHPGAVEALRGLLGEDRRISVTEADGWSVLGRLPDDEGDDRLVLIDPPYVDPADWERAAEAVLALRGGSRVALWYPIAERGHPERLVRQLVARGAVAIELMQRPVDDPGRGLAGSGIVLLDAPPAVLPEIAAAAAIVGPACATGGWSFRIIGG